MKSVPARVSVVVSVYNVAAYLDACLESLAQQSMADLEVVMVDDGSTDESPAIAEHFVARDDRFRLVRQANGGVGAARNTGINHSSADLLAFVDGDDVLPRNAYAALVSALERTGSDFATGNVRRLTSLGTTRAAFVGDAFDRERLETHITRFPSLTADRLVCNKLFRRSFWDRHRFRFPEGVRNEDIPVTMTAHYLAGAVDVVPETVYLWRRREGGDLSGSQRRVGANALRARVGAVDQVSRFLAERGMNDAKFAYDRSVLANDLRYFLDALDTAADDERRLFLELVNDFLDRAAPGVLEKGPAIERLKWHLVRRRALPEVLEVLRFQAEELSEKPPVKGLRHFYGDYPYRGDRRREIPRRLYRLSDELALVAKLNELRWEGEVLRVEGYAYIEMLGAPHPGAQNVKVIARRSGRRRRTVRLETETVFRPDVTADADQQIAALDWSGFVATLDARRLRSGGRWRAGMWKIGLIVRTDGVVRESWRPEPAPLHALPAADVALDGVRLRAGLNPSGELDVRVHDDVSIVRSCAVEEDVMRLHGDVGRILGDELAVSVRRRDRSAVVDCAAETERSGDRRSFAAAVPLRALVSEPDIAERAAQSREQGEGIAWDVFLVGRKHTRRLLLDESAAGSTWSVGGREVVVHRTRYGNLTVVERSVRPVITEIEWSPAGVLALKGSFRAPAGAYELVVRRRRGGDAYAVPLAYDAETSRFTAEIAPGTVDSLAGVRPLAEGQWDFLVRAKRADAAAVTAVVDHALLGALPASARLGHKLFRVGALGYDVPVLDVERNLDDDERGGFRQRQLRTVFYGAQRRRELRDVVLYECFGGREYSDNPRAIHEELVRRGAPYEHVWVVRDARANVPETALAVRELSKEYYEVWATARYVVANDHWPRSFARRADQTWLQTWHGAPLKLLGRDLAGRPKAVREYRRWARQPSENSQYVLSPAPFSTPIIERAFPASDCVVETGLPRTDILLRADRDVLAARVKRRLGLPAGKRVVLYAPTYRDHLASGDGYRFGPLLDLAAIRAALGDDAAVLFRNHRLIVGSLPVEADGVLDASAFPDATELLLAVDTLVTDYSSAIFDFATLGRPIIFFTPDLETYRDQVRGFSIEFEREAPGPLLRTTDEVIDALKDLDAVRTTFAERYASFAARYCPLNDGRAASRVADRVFRW